MDSTASFRTGVTSMPSLNKIRSFRGNSTENNEKFTIGYHSPLRTIHPVPNRRYQDAEIGEKRMVAIPRNKISYHKVSKYANVLIFKEFYLKTKKRVALL